MLDGEYEKYSPAQRSTSSAAAKKTFSRRSQSATSTTAIASTTWRPYRLGSRKSDVTRKNEPYVFATSSFGAKKSSRSVAACQTPIAAKRQPSATAIQASTRGSQGGKGARATIATSAAKGSRKYASRVAPAWRAEDQSSESEA